MPACFACAGIAAKRAKRLTGRSTRRSARRRRSPAAPRHASERPRGAAVSGPGSCSSSSSRAAARAAATRAACTAFCVLRAPWAASCLPSCAISGGVVLGKAIGSHATHAGGGGARDGVGGSLLPHLLLRDCQRLSRAALRSSLQLSQCIQRGSPAATGQQRRLQQLGAHLRVRQRQSHLQQRPQPTSERAQARCGSSAAGPSPQLLLPPPITCWNAGRASIGRRTA